MERALFLELDAPTPRRFAALRRSVRLAESLGIARIWLLPGMAATGAWAPSAPQIWLAALAAETERIRLGWGVPGLWPPTEPPVREAEQAAALDLASEGRLDLALLPAPGPDRAMPVDDDRDDAHAGRALGAGACGGGALEAAVLDEGVRMLVDMWAPATFSWTSARFAVPPIDVLPKPLQQPHPPLWLVGWSAEHARAAGRAGLALLDVTGGDLALWQAHRACQVEARAAADPTARAGPARFAVAVDLREGSELAAEALAGCPGPARRAWLASLAAAGVDAIVLRVPLDHEGQRDDEGRLHGDGRLDDDAVRRRAAPEDGDDDASLRRIRWLAAVDAEDERIEREAASRPTGQTDSGEGR